MKKSRLFYIQLTFTIILCALMVAPVVLSVLAGVTENYFKGISSGLTLRWLKEVWDLYQDSIWLTLMIAISCVILTILIGVPAASALYRSGKRLRNIAETLLMLPVAVPGLATALALLLTYGGTRWLRDSWGFILIGHVIFTLPFMVSPVLAVLRGSNVSQLEEAAASLGAPFANRFFTIILPNCIGGILAGAMMVLTLSIGEFNLTWMLHTPLTKTLPVGLADTYASMRLEIGSAYTLIFLIMILPILLLMQGIGRRINTVRH